MLLRESFQARLPLTQAPYLSGIANLDNNPPMVRLTSPTRTRHQYT